jgi:hypothetical protein
MGGKSTLMRETAGLAILAHVVCLKNMRRGDKNHVIVGKLCSGNIMYNECM